MNTHTLQYTHTSQSNCRQLKTERKKKKKPEGCQRKKATEKGTKIRAGLSETTQSKNNGVTPSKEKKKNQKNPKTVNSEF